MRYFITGATGFIGKRLVRKLLEREGSEVYFLMREASADKLPALLAFWNPQRASAIPVRGDVRAPGLGIDAREAAALAGGIDHFFHLAAIYDLKAAPEAQIVTNVDGTRHAVELANALQVKHFHHVSSIAAAGLYEGMFREDMFDEAEHLDHPYFSTKHASEKIVRTACAVPWTVYRPGMVVGDSRTGEMDKIDGPYYFFKPIQRLRRLLPQWMPAIGIEGGRINLVPVDYVVDAMCHIAHQPRAGGECFHLTDPAPLRVGTVLDIFARSAHAPALSLRINAALFGFVPDAVAKGVMAMKPVRRLKDALMRDFGLPDGILQFANYPTRFDNREAARALEGSGIACPRLEQYADRLWDYWERNLDPELFVDRSLRGQVEGKTVLVTGGSSGIGLATARKLAEAGAITLICGRDAGKLAAARETIRARGHDVLTYQVNLADAADCERFVQTLIANHDGVDILINNAGRSIRRPIEASFDRLHDFERTMQLNYFGALRMTMGLLPKMMERRAGQVINISSIGVLTNAPRFSAYVASKAALDAWTLCAASEFADVGIKFTTINMPLVRTPMIAPTGIYRDVPTLSPDEAADLVVRAIVDKPVRIATRIGLAGQGLHTVMPHAAQIILNTAFRMFADMEPAAKEGEKAAPPLSAEQRAMQQLLRGVHF
ncbi:SDR family oxidoreductase [Noviherbaspirillum sp. UKPF54]|uniref:SDR family oxidoreductase n=1 Tax=Noviherbaspirillum sp. UKPF54 TaxID=2601898 RepID=UPI0011B139C9|nr:SDR family oxidoreductase [Noviherbaspirillum sp. UKPF54]QDZ29443.1 SDR family oxidoreductase [Noviherbaspirillum sp. UKPF54]